MSGGAAVGGLKEFYEGEMRNVVDPLKTGYWRFNKYVEPSEANTVKEYPDRYVITGMVNEGEYKGQKVWLYWSAEAGGWWQWSRDAQWACRFEHASGERYEDAMKSAKGSKWMPNGCGPWYYFVDLNSVEVEPVPAIVNVR